MLSESLEPRSAGDGLFRIVMEGYIESGLPASKFDGQPVTALESDSRAHCRASRTPNVEPEWLESRARGRAGEHDLLELVLRQTRCS